MKVNLIFTLNFKDFIICKRKKYTYYGFYFQLYLKYEDDIDDNIYLNYEEKKIIFEGIQEFKISIKREYNKNVFNVYLSHEKFYQIYVKVAKEGELLDQYDEKYRQLKEETLNSFTIMRNNAR